MPIEKQYINGFDESDNKQYRRKKSTFDKSTVIADSEKSCFDCVNSKTLDMTIKRTCYGCTETNYVFMSYWKETNAKNCEHFKSNK